MPQIPPMILREKYYLPMEQEVQRLFDLLIYTPLARLFKGEHAEMFNAMGDLLRAVRDGDIWYADGQFQGKFSSKTTIELRKLGAVYNRVKGTWKLAPGDVPADIRIAQADADDRVKSLRRSILDTLDGANIQSIDEYSKTKDKYKTAINWMNDDFSKAVRAITIPPNLTDTQRQMIADQWGQNLDLYIKGWVEQDIFRLREKVQTHALTGGRAESLRKMIQENYGVSKSKAKFLARQETGLLMSKFQQSRYKDMGVRKYKWSTSHDERVRPDHRVLNGKIFRWDDPPVTDKRTGAKNNPGEDYNCRCIAIPWRDDTPE